MLFPKSFLSFAAPSALPIAAEAEALCSLFNNSPSTRGLQLHHQQSSSCGSCWAFRPPRYGRALHISGLCRCWHPAHWIRKVRKVFASTVHLSTSPEASIYQLLGPTLVKVEPIQHCRNHPSKGCLKPHHCPDSCWFIKSLQQFKLPPPLPHQAATTSLQEKEQRSNTPAAPVQSLSKSFSLLVTETVTAGVENITP